MKFSDKSEFYTKMFQSYVWTLHLWKSKTSLLLYWNNLISWLIPFWFKFLILIFKAYWSGNFYFIFVYTAYDCKQKSLIGILKKILFKLSKRSNFQYDSNKIFIFYFCPLIWKNFNIIFHAVWHSPESAVFISEKHKKWRKCLVLSIQTSILVSLGLCLKK